MTAEEQAQQFRESFTRIRSEIQKAIVGQDEVINNVLTAIIVGGHVLLEGVPGLGKTYLVRTLGEVLDIKFSRIQFTPDLMPADIMGTNLIVETPGGGKEFRFQAGPVFANIILADEINRATPKTQSALLEAMQENSVTTGGEIRKLEQPFFVMATQNPIEMEGTYPLPEAQLDRFFFKVNVPFPSIADLANIVDRTTGAESARPQKVIERAALLEMRSFVRNVTVAPEVKNYALRLVLATHPGSEFATEKVRKFVRYGSSPRGAQTVILAAKASGMLDGRYHASFGDVAAAALPALRHRMILNFEGEAEGIRSDDILRDILESVPKTASQ
ncbi:MAG: MoxR family ATPase [Candidatus Sumerlaeaceae bacterium]|nr:MoxR family ATPase [Candidatus Sumerlaeaceae bacterium]